MRVLVTIVGASLALMLQISCGNLIEGVDHVGVIAAEPGTNGAPVLLVRQCGTGIVRIEIYEGRTPNMASDEPNTRVGTWTAAASTDDTIDLDLGHPGSGWNGDSVAGPAGETLWVVTGTFVGRDRTVLGGPSFTAADIEALGAGEVLGPEGPVPRVELSANCG